MTGTDDLIEVLAAEARPVRRLAPPLIRSGAWLTAAGAAIGGVLAVYGFCPHLSERLADPLYVACIAASGLTGVLAAAAAFHVCLPDQSRLWAMLPGPAAVSWLAVIVTHCVTRWSVSAGYDPVAGDTGRCAVVFTILSVALGLTLTRMLRPGPLGRGWVTALLAGLAVGGLATFGFSLTRTFGDSPSLLSWNLGAGVLTASIVMAARDGRMLCRIGALLRGVTVWR